MNLVKFGLVALLLFVGTVVYTQDIIVFEQYEEFAPLLKKRNDTTYVINFWATWCKPCVKELPDFIEVNDKFKNDKFKMILVSMDFDSQLESKVKPFILANNINAEVVLLADSKQHKWIDKVDPEWSGSIPITIIFNKDFYFFREGSVNSEELNEIINKNIKK